MDGKINITTQVLDDGLKIEVYTQNVDRCITLEIDTDLTVMDIFGWNFRIDQPDNDPDGFTQIRLNLGDDTSKE